MQMCFFAGVSVTLLIFAFFLYFVHPQLKSDSASRADLFSADAIYRTCYIFIFIILASGICVSVWTRYNINYMYIFDFSAKHKLTQWQLFKVGFFLATVTLACICLVDADIKLDDLFGEEPSGWIVLALVAFFVIYCF